MSVNKAYMLGAGLIVFCLIIIHGCHNQSPVIPDLEPDGTLVAFTGCKSFVSGASASGFLAVEESNQECLEYTYVGSVLRIKHINASFNCCLDGIVGSVNIDGNSIRIESEGRLANGQGCFCDCLYDVEYEIVNIPPSVYVIAGPTFSRSFEIDLRKKTSDRYCEPRNSYPWK
jgi:hypothetical protein